MNQELYEWQKIDEDNGLVMPWYTHGALDKIKTWDLSDKTVLEYGAGYSTLWWANKSYFFASVDHSDEWTDKVNELLSSIGKPQNVRFVNTHEGDQTYKRDEYVRFFDGIMPDIVIVDGIHRYECAEHAVNFLKPKILIIDNHQQDFVFMCPKLDELLDGVKMDRFIQPDHVNHEGNPWATAIFYL